MTDLPIGNSLRKQRFVQNEMTQAQLAKVVGVTRQTIIALEASRYAPSLELAMKLATVFGVKLDELFYWKEEEQARSKYAQKGNTHE